MNALCGSAGQPVGEVSLAGGAGDLGIEQAMQQREPVWEYMKPFTKHQARDGETTPFVEGLPLACSAYLVYRPRSVKSD